MVAAVHQTSSVQTAFFVGPGFVKVIAQELVAIISSVLLLQIRTLLKNKFLTIVLRTVCGVGSIRVLSLAKMNSQWDSAPPNATDCTPLPLPNREKCNPCLKDADCANGSKKGAYFLMIGCVKTQFFYQIKFLRTKNSKLMPC